MVIKYNDMIRNKDLLSFNKAVDDVVCVCPDCNTDLTLNNQVEEYDSIFECPKCGLKIYVKSKI